MNLSSCQKTSYTEDVEHLPTAEPTVGRSLWWVWSHLPFPPIWGLIFSSNCFSVNMDQGVSNPPEVVATKLSYSLSVNFSHCLNRFLFKHRARGRPWAPNGVHPPPSSKKSLGPTLAGIWLLLRGLGIDTETVIWEIPLSRIKLCYLGWSPDSRVHLFHSAHLGFSVPWFPKGCYKYNKKGRRLDRSLNLNSPFPDQASLLDALI